MIFYHQGGTETVLHIGFLQANCRGSRQYQDVWSEICKVVFRSLICLPNLIFNSVICWLTVRQSSLIFTRTNTLGTHTFINSCIQMNVKKIIHVSTDEVYGQVFKGFPNFNSARVFLSGKFYYVAREKYFSDIFSVFFVGQCFFWSRKSSFWV